MTSPHSATDISITWRTASFCNTGNCVEVAHLPNGGVGMRDSKMGGDAPVLQFTVDQWRHFVEGIKSGEI
jgi:hypothetical protein